MVFASTYVSRIGKGKFLLLILVAVFLLWNTFLPKVVIHYSGAAKTKVYYLWNKQHNIYRDDLLPGNVATENGTLFPSNDFFLLFDWGVEHGFQGCIDIAPVLFEDTDIYIDKNARIDILKTGPKIISRLRACDGELDPFRS